jgi:uncharacterized Zn finger protein
MVSWVASGFVCPKCGDDEKHEIVEMYGYMRLKLRCLSCAHQWIEEVV